MTPGASMLINRPRFEKPGLYFMCLLLIALCWFSHFSRFRELGFYEDDHWFAVSTLSWPPSEILRFIVEQIRIFPHPQGRPIGFILGDLIPWISYRIGGLPAIYIASWIIFSTNTILLFTLLRRCLAPPLPLIAAIAFILFPADTTRPFICHADILQTSVTFTLIACHLQLCEGLRHRYLAYLFALFSLVTYETALLPFAVFPLLHRRWDWQWTRQFAIHLLILVALGAGFFLIRKSGGESRVVDASMTAQSVIQRIWTGTGIGIETVFKLCRTRAMQGETDFDQRRQPRSELKIAGTVIGLSVLASSLVGGRKVAGSRPGPNSIRTRRRGSARRGFRRNQQGSLNTETRWHGEEKTQKSDQNRRFKTLQRLSISFARSFLLRASLSPCLILRCKTRNVGKSMKQGARKKENKQTGFLRALAPSRRMAESAEPMTAYKYLLTSALRAAAFAAAGLSISYIFCFTHYPPDYEEGRLTSTHLAAALPVAALMAAVAVFPILLLPRSIGSLLTACLVGFYFTCLFAAARDEQRGYVQIWRARQHLWTCIVELCPDITDGTLIAFEGTVPQPAYFMGTASWSDYMVLGEIFNFAPFHFHRDPMAAYFPTGTDGKPTWQNNIKLDSTGRFIWNQSPFGVSANQVIFDGNLILLHIDQTGNVSRDKDTIQLNGKTFHLKNPPATASVSPFPKLPLFTILTGREIK